MTALTKSEIECIKNPIAQIDPPTGYITNIEHIRNSQYQSLENTTYLDHAGTTLYAKDLIDSFSRDLMQNLYGNPHSASASSQLSTRRIDDVRLRILRFFDASPEDFDVVFVANATAAIKLVADAFHDSDSGFWYGYHVDSHTSLVGVRELAARGSACLTDNDIVSLLQGESKVTTNAHNLCLLAYPGQSNMTGKRLSLDICRHANNLKRCGQKRIYTLFDAAALASTSPLDLSDSASTPDFVALSFYKIFGFPDLGALLVRKDAGEILRRRRFFGGGTVDMVSTSGTGWHAKKETSLHSYLEDGTLPFHSIIALRSAFDVHATLYGSMYNISRHTNFLATRLRYALAELRHSNGAKVCTIYGNMGHEQSDYGPIIALNLRDSSGGYVNNSEFEKLAIVKGIQLRTGGLCNPGGIATYLDLSSDEMHGNYDSGQRCGSGHDVIDGKPTSIIRASLGPMSSIKDVDTLVEFVTEFYVDTATVNNSTTQEAERKIPSLSPRFVIESLSVFPIKSCAAFKIPGDVSWPIGAKGLAWDREWCLVHEGTLVALSQKRYPLMALLRPSIDVSQRLLRITHDIHGSGVRQLSVSLDAASTMSRSVNTCDVVTSRSSSVCGERVDVEHYNSSEIAQFFTDALGVPCTLARFPKDGKIRQAQVRVPESDRALGVTATGRSISLSNESPILLISRSSVNRLNEQIKRNGGVGKAVTADSFRGNIVIAEELEGGQSESPYIEDEWSSLGVGNETNVELEVLGPCQRCQMVCVDQKSAQRRQEPFSTLVKTRRRHGRVWFGMHLCLVESEGVPGKEIRIGDRVTGYTRV